MQAHCSNNATSKKLKQHIDALETIGKLADSRDRKDIPDLTIVFDRFKKYVSIANTLLNAHLTLYHIRDITKVQEDLESLGNSSSWSRAFQSHEISGKLEGYVQIIAWHVNNLQVHIF